MVIMAAFQAADGGSIPPTRLEKAITCVVAFSNDEKGESNGCERTVSEAKPQEAKERARSTSGTPKYTPGKRLSSGGRREGGIPPTRLEKAITCVVAFSNDEKGGGKAKNEVLRMS